MYGIYTQKKEMNLIKDVFEVKEFAELYLQYYQSYDDCRLILIDLDTETQLYPEIKYSEAELLTVGRHNETYEEGRKLFELQPAVPIIQDPDDPTKMILKEDVLDENQLEDYKPTGEEKKPYEPKTLEEYIGQEESKDQIKASIRIINELKPIHILLNGWAGCGKTALARITSNMLGANFIYKVPEQLKNIDDLVEVLNQIQRSEKLTVFMLDEIHTIPVKVANVLLPILQDGVYGNKNIRPFVMIGATTDKDKLIKKQAPLVSRFQTQITLDKYTSPELEVILSNYKQASFPDKEVSDADYKAIAKNSRGIPREAIALLLQRLVADNMGQVLQRSKIVSDGLTKIDIEILTTLKSLNKPVGANYLSQAVGIPQADYEIIYERFLIEKRFIYRQARGRVISDKGVEFLNTIIKKELK